MKKMSKILALALAVVMILPLAACGKEKSDVYKVGICQLVQHEALDAATQGFMDALTEALGDKVTFDNQNASGDSPMCSTIVGQFIANDVDLIMANATPVLGTSVTDYKGCASGFRVTASSKLSKTSWLLLLSPILYATIRLSYRSRIALRYSFLTSVPT